MDAYSSEDKFNIKTRKPYTITKQRERWTEEEHNSFLEALKLYGRAWQRIEEHIGTKTAVQIRSHAQKFFTKLEKEAVAKGVPARQALDMEIPPPRPKRKPNYPYPRKTGPAKNHHHQNPKEDNPNHHPTLVSSLQSGIQILDLDKKPLPEKPCQDAPCASLSSENENSIPRSVVAAAGGGVFRELINLDETNESYITTIETRKHQKCTSDQDKRTSNASSFGFAEGQNSDNTQGGVHNCPRHVPVKVVDGNQGEMSTLEKQQQQPEEVDNPNPNLSVNNNNNIGGYHQTVPTFHPLLTTPLPFCDNQRSFLHVSSTISSLIVSSLLQNPAAHAAASFAAKFWGNTATEAAADSSSSMENPPSMAAIAAATVAAATAWWAAHGLLPVCTPFYPPPPPFPFGTPVVEAATNNNEREKASSSEDSDGKLNTQPNPDDDIDGTTKGTTPPVVEVHDLSKRKQVDRSSCGSNTTSSSEIETDALIKDKEEIKDVVNLAASCNNNDSVSRTRGGRSIVNPNESWKEVSEEGRLAFQALFSRQVLPQSFSDRHNNNNNNNNNSDGQSELDLNRMSCCPPSQQLLLRGEKNHNNVEEGLLTIGLGNVKLNVHHTGFKPYKRCSMEAKETTTKIASTHNDNDKGAKRMRFETEAST